MRRRSSYRHDQHLVSTVTATSSGLASSRPGTPADDLRLGSPDGGIVVTGNSVDFNGAVSENYRPEHPIPEKIAIPGAEQCTDIFKQSVVA